MSAIVSSKTVDSPDRESLVRANDLSKVNLAFFTVNGVVSMVLGGLAIADVLLH